MRAIIVVVAIFLFFYLLDKYLDTKTRCPKCTTKMEKVYGWNKLSCPDCNHTVNF